MTYRVRMSPVVLESLRLQIKYFQSQGAPQAHIDAWITDLLAAVDSLEHMPRRFPIAEAVSTAFGSEVRRLIRGDYAFFFRVDDATATVDIMAFRHGRQSPPTDIRET